MLQNATARERRSLAGMWRAIPDLCEAGYRSPMGEPWALSWFRSAQVRPGLAEYDFDRADEELAREDS